MTNYIFLNILFFILTTILYLVSIRPKLTIPMLLDPNAQVSYEQKRLVSLGIYFVLVLLVQFVINCSTLSSTCGGNISQNIGSAASVTFLNWFLIFGILMISLVAFPGFKSAFSDVVGYLFVSKNANEVLTNLLIDPKLSGKIDAASQGNPEKKRELETAADTIIKICGNTLILINQLTPLNFMEYWGLLKPLMKDQYQEKNQVTDNIQNQLFNLVLTKDVVGEAMWYLYTGIFVIFVVQYKISSAGCKTNSALMEENYKKFQEEEDKKKNFVQ